MKVITMEEISFKNITGADINNKDIFYIDFVETLNIDTVEVQTTDLESFESFFTINSESGGVFTFSNAVFSDIYIGDGVGLIKIESLTELHISELTFNGIYSIDDNDATNVMLDLVSIEPLSDTNYTVSGVNIQDTKVGFLSLSNVEQTEEVEFHLTVENVVIENSYIEFSKDLVYFSALESRPSFEVTFNNFEFNNLTFIRGGNLMNFEHQLNEQVYINNTMIQEVTFGGITIEALDMVNVNVTSKVAFNNLTLFNNYGKDRSIIVANEGAVLEITSSNFIQNSNILYGPVLSAGSRAADVKIYDSLFTNNTAVRGGVFQSQSESKIQCYNCTITNNFAVSSAVIKADNDGTFEFYEWEFKNNYAFYAIVTEIFSSNLESIIDHCTITQNYALSKSEIEDDYLQRSHINELYKEFILSKPSFLSGTVKTEAVQVLLGTLSIQNNTIVTDQDRFLLSVYSTLAIDDLVLEDNSLSGSTITVTESTFTANGISISNTTSSSSLEFMLISYSNFTITSIDYQSSQGILMRVIYSDGSLSGLTVENATLYTLMQFRACTLASIDNIDLNNLTIEDTYAIYFIHSQINQMDNWNLKNINEDVIYFDESGATSINEFHISSSLSAMELSKSSISNMNNSVISG